MLLLAALPEFVIAVLLVILFATTVSHIFPAISPVPPGTEPWDNPEMLVLPTLSLVLAVAPYVSRIMRASMVEVLESDYVEMARLKGLPERTVLIRHALPNAHRPGLPGHRASTSPTSPAASWSWSTSSTTPASAAPCRKR